VSAKIRARVTGASFLGLDDPVCASSCTTVSGDPRVEQVLPVGIRSVDVEEVRFARAQPERALLVRRARPPRPLVRGAAGQARRPPSYGSYSGAVPNEKTTWEKLSIGTPRFVIGSDATIVAPLIFAYALAS
jgi:deoxyhypusine synthase